MYHRADIKKGVFAVLKRISQFFASLLRDESRCGRERLFDVCTEAVIGRRLYLDRSLSLEILARELGTNRLYLSKALALSGGFTKYINGFRLQYAAQLMASSAGRNMRLSEIAERSGFISERVMNYYLVKHCGTTAREMRRRVMAGAGVQAKNFSTPLMASGRAKTATRS